MKEQSSLYQEIVEMVQILDGAKAVSLEGRKCFIVNHGQFCRIVELIRSWGWEADGSEILAVAGYGNVRINLSVKDKGTYYVCEEAQPLLDPLWAKKAPKETQ